MSITGRFKRRTGTASCLIPAIVNGRNMAHVDNAYKDNFPITAITWLDAVAFANALSEMEELSPVYYEDEGMTKVFKGFARKKREVLVMKTVIWGEISQLPWSTGGQKVTVYQRSPSGKRQRVGE